MYLEKMRNYLPFESLLREKTFALSCQVIAFDKHGDNIEPDVI